MMGELLQVDGSTGGGQLLRSSLSLSALSGRGFVMRDIRKPRRRPGLMRQHLAAVRAAAQICGAAVEGAELGSTHLTFCPGPVRAGSYQFAISTAGSACLVLQTVLPPLMVARAPSELQLEGGTHNPLAPPYPFLDRVFLPVLERMGVGLTRKLGRAGFYPAGGGRFDLRIEPVEQLRAFSLVERGRLLYVSAEALVANLPHEIGLRELSISKARLALRDEDVHLRTPEASGPGNVLLLTAHYENASELVTGFGERHVRAEHLTEQACKTLLSFMHASAPVSEHLADQLLIPLAMARAGCFRTHVLSAHTRSNMRIVEQFLPVRFVVREEHSEYTISVDTP